MLFSVFPDSHCRFMRCFFRSFTIELSLDVLFVISFFSLISLVSLALFLYVYCSQNLFFDDHPNERVLIPGQRSLEEGLCLFSLLQAWLLVSCFFSVSPRNPLLNYWVFLSFLWLLSVFDDLCIASGWRYLAQMFTAFYPYKFLDV